MKFGIFFELSVPRPLIRANEQLVYRNSLEQARLADELGFETVWAVEHHFPAGGRGSDNPKERRPVPDGIAIGDPDRIVKAIKVWEAVGIDGINFVLNTTELIPQEQVLDSMRLFAASVMPAFA